MTFVDKTSPDRNAAAGDRFDSWKEIAIYLKRGVRAVQRWEKDENLPVHRHQHKKQGSVYAYKQELDAWQKGRERRRESAAHPEHEAPPEGKRYSENFEANTLYQQGRFHWEKRTGDGLQKAVRCFESTVGCDPQFAPAHAGLADCYNLLAYHGYLPPHTAFPKAKTAAQEALRQDADLAEAHASLGFSTLFHEWDWNAAQKHFRRALELRPEYAIAHYWLGLNQAAMGRLWEAAAAVRRALELDPSSRVIHTYVAGAYYFARQYERAVEKCQTVLEMEPDFAPARLVAGWAHRQSKHFDRAIAQFKTAEESSSESAEALAALGHAYAASGQASHARKILKDLMARRKREYVSAGHIALVYLGLNDNDAALAWLQTACDERYPGLVFLKIDPVFDSLRPHPGFPDLVARVGLP